MYSRTRVSVPTTAAAADVTPPNTSGAVAVDTVDTAASQSSTQSDRQSEDKSDETIAQQQPTEFSLIDELMQAAQTELHTALPFFAHLPKDSSDAFQSATHTQQQQQHTDHNHNSNSNSGINDEKQQNAHGPGLRPLALLQAHIGTSTHLRVYMRTSGSLTLLCSMVTALASRIDTAASSSAAAADDAPQVSLLVCCLERNGVECVNNSMYGVTMLCKLAMLK
jgi:hypothetical protein